MHSGVSACRGLGEAPGNTMMHQLDVMVGLVQGVTGMVWHYGWRFRRMYYVYGHAGRHGGHVEHTLVAIRRSIAAMDMAMHCIGMAVVAIISLHDSGEVGASGLWLCQSPA
jgi:hypothetical protein